MACYTLDSHIVKLVMRNICPEAITEFESAGQVMINDMFCSMHTPFMHTPVCGQFSFTCTTESLGKLYVDMAMELGDQF